jgi:hypothetical protein
MMRPFFLLCLRIGEETAWRAALACPPRPRRGAVLVHIVRGDGRRLRAAGVYARAAISPPASLPAFLDGLIAPGDFNAGGRGRQSARGLAPR